MKRAGKKKKTVVIEEPLKNDKDDNEVGIEREQTPLKRKAKRGLASGKVVKKLRPATASDGLKGKKKIIDLGGEDDELPDLPSLPLSPLVNVKENNGDSDSSDFHLELTQNRDKAQKKHGYDNDSSSDDEFTADECDKVAHEMAEISCNQAWLSADHNCECYWRHTSKRMSSSISFLSDTVGKLHTKVTNLNSIVSQISDRIDKE